MLFLKMCLVITILLRYLLTFFILRRCAIKILRWFNQQFRTNAFYLLTYKSTILFFSVQSGCFRLPQKCRRRWNIVFYVLKVPNVDLKICQYLCFHMKIICWRFHIKIPFTSWDMHAWDMWKVCLQTFGNNRLC